MKYYKFLNPVIIIVLITISSCDCLQYAQGIVICSSSKAPVDSVKVNKFYTDTTFLLQKNTYTNSNGRFHIKAMAGGLFRCANLKLFIQKDGYEKVIKEYRSCCIDNDTIFLKKLDK